jgi:NAD(P)H dehydrogenase (quinone)
MSGHVAVIYTGRLTEVALVVAEAASHIATEVRTARLPGADDRETGAEPEANLSYLEWADGIAFGTPAGTNGPASALMGFLDSSEPLWKNGRLYDKAVTVFTDEPERMAADSILHPVYDALYRWGAVIVGPRYFDLSLDKPVQPAEPDSTRLSDERLRAARYRAHRLARLASVLAEERGRRETLQL